MARPYALLRAGVLACALCLIAGSALATQYTNQIILPANLANNWVDLGAGPLTVSTVSTFGTKIAVSDTQPAASFVGELLTGLRHYEGASHVWALSYTGNTSSVTVTNESIGSAGAVTVNQSVATGTGGFTSATVGTTSAQALAARTGTQHVLALDNENAPGGAAIACNFGGAAALNTAPSFTIPAGQTRTWSGAYVPLDAVNCTAGAANSQLTIEAN